jgi:hypothetical protein
MKTTLHLDYSAILARTAQPVHLAFNFQAEEVVSARPQPIAFVAVIDRSGSMEGAPLAAAKQGLLTVLRHLRPGDAFGVVAFDDEAQTIVPLAVPADRAGVAQVIASLEVNGSTNLAAGWSLGRDLLRTAAPGTARKLLLLTDGQLNTGITDPDRVRQLVAAGRETHGIRTTALGFGDQYNEDLLKVMAEVSQGALYDANAPDRLPEIFRVELEGLQDLAVQNLRLRVRPSACVERCTVLGDYPAPLVHEGWQETALGDLVSGEERRVIVGFQVLPIPPLPDGTPAATWEGELLAEVELRCDVISASGLESRCERHTVRVRPVQDPADVQINAEVFPWVAFLQAVAAVQQALKLFDESRGAEGLKLLEETIARYEQGPASALRDDALNLLRRTQAELRDGEDYGRSRKSSYARLIRLSTLSSDISAEKLAEDDVVPSFSRDRKRRSKTPPPPPASK